MSSNKLRCVLFGMGRMGKNHYRVLKEDPRFDLLAIVDPALRALDPSFLPTHILQSGDALKPDDFDCAVVATPTNLHYGIAKSLIEDGKDLLIEKPLANTFAECRELVEAAASRGVRLAVGHVERLNPAVRKLREVIAAGLIGTPIHFTITRVGGYPETLTEGNNVIIDLAVHDLDVLRSLIGPLKVVSSFCHSTVKEGICDTAEILLASMSGASATVHVNWITPTKIRTLRVTGTRAVCFVDYILQTCTIVGGDLLHTRVEHSAPYGRLVEMYRDTDRLELGIKKEEPLRVQLDQFYRLLKHGEAGDLCLGPDASGALLLAQRAFYNWKASIPARSEGLQPQPVIREDAEWI